MAHIETSCLISVACVDLGPILSPLEGKSKIDPSVVEDILVRAVSSILNHNLVLLNCLVY